MTKQYFTQLQSKKLNWHDISQAKVLYFTEATFSLEIILFFYRRLSPCKKMYSPYLIPSRSACQPDYVLYPMPHNFLRPFTMEL